jgi:hypothetical protein
MRFPVIFSLAFLLAAPLARAEKVATANEELLIKIINREHAVTEDLQRFHPIVETYIQSLKRRHGRLVPWRDHYFLSLAQFSGQLRALRFKPRGLLLGRYLEESIDSSGLNSLEFDASGFVAMAYPDASTFDLDHYRLQYLNKEFLGEVRCLVFEVHPIARRKSGLFEGRVWVEDQNFTIVRFNGIYKGSNILSKYFHFDSWRVNAGPGLWVPAAIYSEELGLPCCGAWKFNWTKFRFKAQTRFWGYDLQFPGSEEEMAKIVVDPSSRVRDRTGSSEDKGPIEQQLDWERQAEDNVSNQMQGIGLLAPVGEIEKTLQTVVNNIEVTNNLSINPEVRCRVLLTSKLESVVIGHTIMLSRGFIDVIPDEATLAAVLARGLALVVFDNQAYTDFAFADKVMFGPRDAVRKLHFDHSDKEERQAASLAGEWMTKSPYKNSLDSINRFVVELRLRSFPIYHLLEPNFGDSAYDTLGAEHVGKKILTVKNRGEVRALPLGSRIIVDPWSDKIAFLRAGQANVQAPKDSVPFEVTPFSLYLRRTTETNSSQFSSFENRN